MAKKYKSQGAYLETDSVYSIENLNKALNPFEHTLTVKNPGSSSDDQGKPLENKIPGSLSIDSVLDVEFPMEGIGFVLEQLQEGEFRVQRQYLFSPKTKG